VRDISVGLAGKSGDFVLAKTRIAFRQIKSSVGRESREEGVAKCKRWSFAAG
jgi:hypothetical protein